MHAARKDSAVHVSLSSYSPIKQPGARNPIPDASVKPAKQPPPTESRWLITAKCGASEAHHPAAQRRAPCPSFICNPLGYCQPSILEFFITSSQATAAVFSRGVCVPVRRATADLKPPILATIFASSVPPYSSHNHEACSCLGNTGRIVPASEYDQSKRSTQKCLVLRVR
jgi:hypothetical protein